MRWIAQSDENGGVDIQIEYDKTVPPSKSVLPVSDRVRWGIRRHLSEFRDDSLMKASGLYGFAQAASKRLRRIRND